jgi:hypothetical protein
MIAQKCCSLCEHLHCSSMRGSSPNMIKEWTMQDMVLLLVSCCDSSVSIALGYRLDDQGSRVRFLAGAPRMALGPTELPIQYVPGALSLGVKQPWREADHSPLSSAKVKEWVELYLHSPNTPSWLKKSTGTTLPLPLLLPFPSWWTAGDSGWLTVS